VLKQIDAYPTPKGVSAQTWAMLVAELKKQLIVRSKDGKTLSIAPVGPLCKVTDLAAASNPAGTQATLTWTEVLGGDCNNDGQVSISDLQPIAAHYGEASSGPGSPAYLADANGDGEVGIADLQPVAANYMAQLAGYQVWRGHWNGTSTDWETAFRPNVDDPAKTGFSADRTTLPPATSRPVYTYTDDISTLTDKANVRYKVTAYGNGAPGEESGEATMTPPPTFAVSGRVTISGNGLAGVAMTLTPGGLSATTQADGSYVISGVPYGDYTLTPSLSGYSFTPPTLSVSVTSADVTGQNFTATAGTRTVSGTVLEGGSGLAGVTMTLTPGGLAATTQADGTYVIFGVGDGSYTLTPTKSWYTFTPPNRSVTVSGANVTGMDFTASPVGHNVSGTVTEGGVGLAGVLMDLSGSGGGTAVTGAGGTYVIQHVLDNGYTLTPTKAGYQFTPQNKYVCVSGADVTGQDFTAAKTRSISGTVTSSGVGLAGVTVSLAPGGLTAQTAADGTYAIPNVQNGDYTLTPYKITYVFTPISRAVTMAGADVTGQDFAGTLAVGLAGTAWPKFRGNAKNTGLSQYVGAQTNNVKWSYSGLQAPATGSPAIATDGTVYACGGDFASSGRVLAIAPATNLAKWIHAFSQPLGSSLAIGADGTLFIGTWDDKLYALNPADGSVAWTYSAYNSIDISSPAVAASGTVYVGSLDTYLHAVNPADGSLIWKCKTGGAIQNCPAIGDDGTIYFGSEDKNIYAVNPVDGSVKWKTAVGDIVEASSPAIGPDGTIYVGCWDYNLYALNPGDGSVKWTYPTSGQIDGSPAVGPDGTVYVGSWDHNVYAINPDGTLKWKFPTGDVVESSPAVGADGTVYVGSYDYYLYALKPADGAVLWSFKQTSMPQIRTSPAISSDGTTYLAAGRLWALGP
jgi:outer membrane protein assembly factor BamB